MASAPGRYILLADDDEDDCFLFQEALAEISLPTHLAMVHDGERLILELEKDKIPDILFLDLNMPKKDGFQCLAEIKRNEKFRLLPVIIFSTSFQPDVVDKLYENGAHFYIRKPSKFEHFKKVIHYVVSLTQIEFPARQIERPTKEKFVLEPEKV